MGALDAAIPPDQTGSLPTSGKTVARTLAYGGAQPDQFQGALSALMDPERSKDTENKAWWAGFNQPQSGGQGAGNALAAQVAVREKQDQLRAAYIPLIMQTLTQQRSNELAYAQFAQQRAEKTNPMINSALYGMQANGNVPTIQDAHKRIDDVGSMFNMGPQELLPHHLALQRGAGEDGSQLPNYLQQLRVAAAPPAEGLTKFGTNAAGQTTGQNSVTGGVEPVGTANVNPAKTDIELMKMYRGDPGKYTDDLSGTLNSYNDILQRGNAINDALNSFQPGKYAQNVTGLAAATKDLARMFPNAATKSVNDYVTSLMGPQGNGQGANPVAAAQFAESLKTQETLAQLKASLDGQGRIGQMEFRSLNGAMLGISSDPKAFDKFMGFARGRAANVANKLQAWGEHAKEKGDSLSVPGFEIPWAVNEATQLIGGDKKPPVFGQVDVPPGVQNPAVPNPQQPMIVQPSAPPQDPGLGAQAQAAPRGNVNLAEYEPGTKLGPTGVPYVMDKGVPRPAKKKGSRDVSGKVTE